MVSANVPWGTDQMEQELSSPLTRARETGSRLYCGEFGVHGAAPLSIRRAWLRDAVRTFEKHDIAWSMWDWKGSFGVVDRDGVPTGVHEALFP